MSIDHENCNIWRPIAISPLLRFIKYTNNGCLLPHYDLPSYVYPDGSKTMLSLVIYLDNSIGGETQFILDPQRDLKALCPKDIGSIILNNLLQTYKYFAP